MTDDNEIQKLIRLKRYEQPREGYFDGFLVEFQRRQRSELLQRSARSLFFERLGTYFSEFGRMQWACAGATACCAIGAMAILASGQIQMNRGNVSGKMLQQVPSVASIAAKPEVGVDLWGVDVRPHRILVEPEEEESLVSREAVSMKRAHTVLPEYDFGMLPTSGAGIIPMRHGNAAPEAQPLHRSPSYQDF